MDPWIFKLLFLAYGLVCLAVVIPMMVAWFRLLKLRQQIVREMIEESDKSRPKAEAAE